MYVEGVVVVIGKSVSGHNIPFEVLGRAPKIQQHEIVGSKHRKKTF